MPKNLHCFISILLCFVFLSVKAQAPKGTSGGQINSQMQTVRGDTCLDKKFSVVVYLIQDSLYSLTTPSSTINTIASYSLSQVFLKLNQTFSNVCVSFEHCKTVIIPNHTFNLWVTNRNGINVIRDYHTENTICLYIPDSIMNVLLHDSPFLDYAYHADTLSPFRNAIVVKKRHLSTANMYHAVGHFFGLPHTFSEINPTQATSPPTPTGIFSKEFADKSNSLTHGDGFTDTEADPFPASFGGTASTANCVPVEILDGKGKFYTPSFENYMSAYVDCSCKFSKEQYYYMVHYIMRKRLYLH
jgi:hypothetical protein